MTLEDRAIELSNRIVRLTAEDAITGIGIAALLIEFGRAVADDEREACAQEADKRQRCWTANLETEHEEEGDAERAATATDIAASIRARARGEPVMRNLSADTSTITGRPASA